MITKIQKWGNSLGVRIPKSLADDAQVASGTPVDLAMEQGRLIITPVSKQGFYRLDELLGHVTKENLPGEISMGEARGREIW